MLRRENEKRHPFEKHRTVRREALIWVAIGRWIGAIGSWNIQERRVLRQAGL